MPSALKPTAATTTGAHQLIVVATTPAYQKLKLISKRIANSPPLRPLVRSWLRFKARHTPPRSTPATGTATQDTCVRITIGAHSATTTDMANGLGSARLMNASTTSATGPKATMAATTNMRGMARTVCASNSPQVGGRAPSARTTTKVIAPSHQKMPKNTMA